MFIEFADDLLNCVIEEKLSDKEIIVLERLASSYQQGFHVISGSVPLLNNLAKNSKLSVSQQESYKKASNKRMNYLWMKSLPYCIIVSNSVTGGIKYCSKNGLTRIYVSLEKMYELCINQRVKFVTESYKDYDFYTSLAKYMNINYFNRSVKVELSRLPGGGRDTAEVFCGGTSEKTICLVIADSDKKSEKSKFGETYLKIEDIIKNLKLSKEAIFEAKHLEVREKENLIPPSIYKITSNSINKSEELEDLEMICLSGEFKKIYYYLDIKDGVKKKEFLELIKESKICLDKLNEEVKFKKFLCSDLDNKLDEELILCGIGELVDNVEKEILGNKLEDKLEELNSKALKHNINQSSFDKLKRKIDKKNKAFQLLEGIFLEEWIDITNLVTSFGCAPLSKL